ncbi:glycosyltransferase family 4 protein [Caldibacillus debilis]|uniref:Glycosyltransferase family 1 protein n=1 Tax=Caldibacillus debilis TaxID=301148 RepID=A0A150M5J4_9BACI|nr:glycosyltransferase family 4 protein [Caldibacillus debilis]KYD19793.1 hypothetical protein B4135_0692 [Caldibacillus debilis]
MKILHICSYYIGNKLYKKLFGKLSQDRNLIQYVYIPIKNYSLINKNYFEAENVNFYYDNILYKRDRFLYKTKIKKQLKRILDLLKEDINAVDLVHAHTLFSDGGTAYYLKKYRGIKYIVSIRNTDINVFYKYGWHLRSFIKEVLLQAEAVIFISEAYKKKVFELFPKKIINKIEHKVYVIPNGIDDMWLKKEIVKSQQVRDDKIHLIFVGSIDKNKNLKTVLKVLKELNQQMERKYYLHIAGEGPLRKKLESYAIKHGIGSDLKFYGYVNEEDLVLLMDKVDIFVLPSIHETFGISYVEAMSRGVPVIYSKNEGIYGFFEEGQVGFSVNPLSVKDIISAIKSIEKNYHYLSTECINQSKNFSWDKIAKIYKQVYQRSIN